MTAAAAYHALLAADPGLAAESAAALLHGQDARGLVYGGRPVCGVLRPRFLTPAQFRRLHDTASGLLPALRAAHARAAADAAFRRQFRLRDWEDDLFALDPGFPEPTPAGRFDAFFASEAGLVVTEFNTETTAGAGYSDSLARLFQGLPAFQEFSRRFLSWPVIDRAGTLHALADSYRRWRGTSNEAPRVAILDWRDAPTFAELVLFYDYFRAMGVEARIVDPRDLEYDGGKLRAGEFHTTLVYRRVAAGELAARCGLDHPLFRAARDRAACVVNPFRGLLLGKKAAVAVLSDERNAALFTPEQRALISAHVPWTRVVEDRRTTADGVEVELVPHVLSNRESLVLRSNDSLGADGTVSGWLVDQPAWEAAVWRALEEPFVVQRKVGLPREPYPVADGGRVAVRDLYVETSPFVAFGEFVSGCLTRVAADAPVNVAAGGSVVPTFVVEPR
ncbi:MAG TPA: hypothetical protein VD866_09840 [Urbifossiella sp.]|nr:hypothetical protein [Urbifossiella sp.]